MITKEEENPSKAGDTRENKEDEARYKSALSHRYQDENQEEEAKHQTTLCLRYQAKNKEEEAKHQTALGLLYQVENKENEARYQSALCLRYQDENEEGEAKHQTTLCLRYQAKTEEEEPKHQAGEPSREAAKLKSFQARDQVTLDRQVKCQSSLSGDSKDSSNRVDGVRLLELGIIDKEESLARPILFSNWRSKNHTPVERGKLRDYTKARHKMFYEEELDVPLVLFNEELDHVLRIDRICQVHNKHSGEDLDEDWRQELRRSGCEDEKICTILDELGNIDKEKSLA